MERSRAADPSRTPLAIRTAVVAYPAAPTIAYRCESDRRYITPSTTAGVDMMRPSISLTRTFSGVVSVWRYRVGFAFAVEEVDEIARQQWRGGERAAEAFLPYALAGCRVEADTDAVVADGVDLASD